MLYDLTDRCREAWTYYDKLLDDNIAQISEISGVEPEHFVKINPAEFCEKNKYQLLRDYEYKRIRDFIREQKKDDETFLISPMDAIPETAAQVSYKAGTDVRRNVRASKCDVLPCPRELALDFFIRNHRQTAPNYRNSAVCYALVYKSEVVAVMLYDISNGGVRGRKKDYELVRLSISKGTRIHGGASKLPQACEATMKEMGVRRIYSYSNATINSGAVYEKLGFSDAAVDGGQPFVIMQDNRLIRLLSLFPHSTDKELAIHGQLKTHIGGNKMWKKEL